MVMKKVGRRIVAGRPVMLGSLQYGLGSSLRAVDRPDDVLAALDAAEEAYGDVLDTGRRDMVQRITDVQVRRARTFQELGRVTDSILEMDGVVRAAVLAGPDGDVFEFELGLSRLLYTNALVLNQYGDPDLILSSADAVVRLITSNGLKVNTLEGEIAPTTSICCAALPRSPCVSTPSRGGPR